MKLSFQHGVLVVVVTLVHMVALSMLMVQPETTEAVSHPSIPDATENSLNLAAERVEESPVEASAPTDAAPVAEIVDQPALPRVMKPLPGIGE